MELIWNVDKSYLKPGDVLICRGKSWISRAIMKITKGKVSHTAYYCQVWGKSAVVEAQRNGVNLKLWKTWQNKWGYDYVAFRNVKQTESEIKQEVIRAFEVIGETKYDFFTFFRRAFGGREERSEKEESKRFICSEFTAWIKNLTEWFDMTPQEQLDLFLGSDSYKMIKG